MKLRDHVYCVIISATIVIVAILLVALKPSDEQIRALSWASIVVAAILGIFAIFFSYYQGERTGRNIDDMKNLTAEANLILTEMRRSLANVEDKTSALDQTWRLLIEKHLTTTEVIETKAPPQVEAMRFNISNCRAFVLLVLYFMVKACEKNRIFSMHEIMSRLFPRSDITELAGSGLGILMCFECLLPSKSVSYEEASKYTIKNMPSEFEQYLLDEINKRITQPPVEDSYVNFLRNSIRKIDNYFDDLSDES